ncbi:hypothetical protein J6590_079974, partial [Homalodisca vitripennis]
QLVNKTYNMWPSPRLVETAGSTGLTTLHQTDMELLSTFLLKDEGEHSRSGKFTAIGPVVTGRTRFWEIILTIALYCVYRY